MLFFVVHCFLLDQYQPQIESKNHFDYIKSSLDIFLSNENLKEKLYIANNNEKIPGSTCGLFIQYNTDLEESSELQKTTLIRLRENLEKNTKKKAQLSMWNDNTTPSKFDDFNKIGELKNTIDNINYIITEI